MRKLYFLLALAQLFTLSAFAQLDITFNGTGRTSTSIGSSSHGYNMLVQPKDLFIVVAGDYWLGTTHGVGLVRFTKDGVLDPNFGIGGKVILPFVYAQGQVSLGIQSNGSIIVGFQMAAMPDGQFPVMVRITNTGQIDYGFSSTGYIAPSLPGNESLDALLIQNDDKIVLGCDGYVFARFSKDGVLDPSYGTAGVFTGPANTGYIAGMAFFSDGSIVATGLGHLAVQTIHLSTKGVQDMNFGTNGFSNLTVNDDPVEISGITVTPGGYILLSGQYYPDVTNPNWRYLIAELDGSGKLNPGFAGNGKLGIPFTGYDAYGQGAIQLQEGQIMMAGYLIPVKNGPVQVGLCRITANGAIDGTFGPGGTEITGWSPSSTSVAANVIAFQGSKIVVGGNLGNGAGYMAMRYLNPIILPPPPIVDATTSTVQNSTLSPTGLPLRLYPNPATQTLNVQGLDPAATTLLQIVDAAGHSMLTTRVSNQSTYALDITQLPSGTYFLTLSTQTARKTLSFVKRR